MENPQSGFLEQLENLSASGLIDFANGATVADVDRALVRGVRTIEDFACLLSEAAAQRLEDMARRAHDLTLQRFGRTIQLFAPLYVSNECANICTYCGFSLDNDIVRKTLTIPQITAEAELLGAKGFRHLLLVSGEHAKYVPVQYLEEAAGALAGKFPSIAIEVGPLSEAEYKRLVLKGVDGLIVYQETYDKKSYDEHHLKGKKRDFEWRLETPDRAARAGMRRLGIGILLGLADWKTDAISLVAHAKYLLNRYWQSILTVSVPRLRPAAGGYEPKVQISDRHFVQLICALRLALPDVGIVLSTREPANLRDGLVKLGVTHMSAGSSTEPGGYSTPAESEKQFEVEDTRSPEKVARMLEALGYEPVWKDWEEALHG